MEFESPSLESSGTPGSGEVSKEVSEKQKESYKKAQAQIQKSQKDEKKAKSDNDDLFAILLRFIQNPYYEELIPMIVGLLQVSTPSRLILTYTALIYPESALHILTILERKSDIDSLLSLHRYETEIVFHEKDLHPSIRNWMSIWVNFTQEYLGQDESSIMMQKKMLTIFTGQTKSISVQSLCICISFFFHSRNVNISESTAKSYAEFIIREYIQILEKKLKNADPDILQEVDMNHNNLFGVS